MQAVLKFKGSCKTEGKHSTHENKTDITIHKRIHSRRTTQKQGKHLQKTPNTQPPITTTPATPQRNTTQARILKHLSRVT
ncbi:hypothetical protein E2C01_098264 [Portunus trituberculatus]|uniref:Uncharacterized protein n=1 Tax=Portunus trituberculatus TaxID=210409 RepID=A0A5B7KBN9_PORTR|nr:hypothetical protein [Portunus trituberculatus]